MNVCIIDGYAEFVFNTQDPTTGAAMDATGTPTYRIYEENNETAVATGNCTKRDDANTTGYYFVRAQCTTVAGFEVGKFYNVRVAATVNDVAGAANIGRFLIVTAAMWAVLTGTPGWASAANVTSILSATSGLDSDLAAALAALLAVINALQATADGIDDAVTVSGVRVISGKIKTALGVGIMEAEIWLTADSDPDAESGTDTGVLVQHNESTQDNGDYLFHVDDLHYWLHARKDGEYDENSVRVASV